MICVIEGATRIALFLGDSFTYQDGILTGPGWQYAAGDGLTLVEVGNPPTPVFVGRAWRLTEAGEWEVHDQALIDAVLPPPAAPLPEMNKRAFRDLAVSIFGFPSWQAAQANPALAEVWDVYASGVTVSRADVLAFLPAFVALGHATQEQADQLLAEWPHA